MNRFRSIGVALSALLLLLAASATSASADAPSGSAQAADVVSVPVSFKVRNVNRTPVACRTDGRHATVRGRLVGPRSAIEGSSSPAVTIYLHGLGFGRFLFNFDQRPDYDYAALQAQQGLVSLVVDRLGYDESTRPDGKDSCLGGQINIAHQLVSRMRSGRYSADGDADTPKFRRVVLGGHSVGGIVAQLEASTFRDVDGVLVISYSDLGATKLAGTSAAIAADVCGDGGERADADGPPRYAFYGQTAQDFQSAAFANGDPSVVEAATALRNRDPCGDLRSFSAAVTANIQNLPKIRVPVLVIGGAQDPLFPPIGQRAQRGLLTGSKDVTVRTIDGAAHAISLERSAPTFRTAVASWLTKRNFTAGTER